MVLEGGGFLLDHGRMVLAGIEECQADEEADEDEAADEDDGDEGFVPAEVHEEQNDKGSLDYGDGEGDDEVELAEVYERGRDGEDSKDDERAEHFGKEGKRHDVAHTGGALPWTSWGAIHRQFAFWKRRFKRRISDQVEEGKEEDPDEVDDVPVEADEIDRREIFGAEIAAIGAEHDPGDQAHAGEDVNTV